MSNSRPLKKEKKWLRIDRVELLIAAIVIATLVVIYNPEILPERHRWHVGNIKSDQRSLATAIETYFMDHNAHPKMVDLSIYTEDKGKKTLKKIGGVSLKSLPSRITTPVGYLSNLFDDPSVPKKLRGLPYAYYTDRKGWIVFAAGLDGDYDITDPSKVYDGASRSERLSDTENYPGLTALTYDPTNGTKSGGDVWRIKQ